MVSAGLRLLGLLPGGASHPTRGRPRRPARPRYRTVLLVVQAGFFLGLGGLGGLGGCHGESTATSTTPAGAASTLSPSASDPAAASPQSRADRIHKLKERVEEENRRRGWQPLGHGLWKSRSGELAFRTVEGTEEGIFIEHYLTRIDEETALIDVVHLPTFRHLGGSFYGDQQHVYHHLEMADGGSFYLFDKADLSSFEVLTGCYARDKDTIYTDRGRRVEGVDIDSFQTKEVAGCFAKDRHGYFFWDTRLDSGDELDDAARQAIRALGPIEK